MLRRSILIGSIMLGQPSLSAGETADAILLEDGTSALLMEDGYDFLLENGLPGNLLLEDGTSFLMEDDAYNIVLEQG